MKLVYLIKKHFKSVYINNFYKTQFKKNCLLCYITFPFVEKCDPYKHQNVWQVREIAKIISSKGYNVDIIDYDCKHCNFDKEYDLIFDISVSDNPIYENNIKDNAKKIIYFTGSNPTFSNEAEKKRIEDLYDRRGVRLCTRRQVDVFSNKIEEYDTFLMIGNDLNFSTYDTFNFKNRYLIPNTGYDFGNKINYDLKSSTNFLFFGSLGCVHKGLDLLLEVFSEKDFPCTLFVCGLYEKESDFKKAFHNELYNTKNIISLGFLDINSKLFIEIASKCGYTVLPSCSEGQAGSIITCMSAGIVPIVSKVCGFNSDEAILLEDCTLSTIKETILCLSKMNKKDLIKECLYYEHLSKTRFSQKSFTDSMARAIEETIG